MNAKLYAFFLRFLLNVMPCIWGGGGKVVELSPDFRFLRVRLKLKLRTRNIMGTIYGGSMYASTDPMYMLMLMQILGKDYVVWDKGCTIRFKRPGTGTMFCDFRITDAMLNAAKAAADAHGETTFTWPVAYRDNDGVTYVEFDKVLYVATKEFYEEKQRQRRLKAAQV